VAWVDIKEDKQFVLNRHVVTSLRPSGNYIIVEDKLVLQVDGNEEVTMVFRIKEDKLIFESGTFTLGLVEIGRVFTYDD